VINHSDANENIDATMDARYGPRRHEHGLRPRRPRNYGHLMTETGHEPIVQETIMTQYSMKKGIKI
jgi:hypothetical protein